MCRLLVTLSTSAKQFWKFDSYDYLISARDIVDFMLVLLDNTLVSNYSLTVAPSIID